MKSVNAFCDALKQAADKTRTNKHGNTLHDVFMPDERYRIDFANDFTAEGWEQFDTDQDAHYFGVWMNRRNRQILTYAEGDWTLSQAADDDAYFAEVAEAIEFYGEGFVAKTMDHGGNWETYRQDRSRFLCRQ